MRGPSVFMHEYVIMFLSCSYVVCCVSYSASHLEGNHAREFQLFENFQKKDHHFVFRPEAQKFLPFQWPDIKNQLGFLTLIGFFVPLIDQSGLLLIACEEGFDDCVLRQAEEPSRP